MKNIKENALFLLSERQRQAKPRIEVERRGGPQRSAAALY